MPESRWGLWSSQRSAMPWGQDSPHRPTSPQPLTLLKSASPQPKGTLPFLKLPKSLSLTQLQADTDRHQPY